MSNLRQEIKAVIVEAYNYIGRSTVAENKLNLEENLHTLDGLPDAVVTNLLGCPIITFLDIRTNEAALQNYGETLIWILDRFADGRYRITNGNFNFVISCHYVYDNVNFDRNAQKRGWGSNSNSGIIHPLMLDNAYSNNCTVTRFGPVTILDDCRIIVKISPQSDK